MRFVLVLAVLSGAAFAQDALSKAKKRGPIPVPAAESGRECFVPKFLEGEKCAEGFQLCVETEGVGSCSGYGRTTKTLHVEYADEPTGTKPSVGMPYSHEAGYDEEVELSMTCRASQIGFGVALPSGLSDEARAAEKARLEAKAEKAAALEVARCEKEARARLARERKWQRCELLSVDACRREAFLQCKGNTDKRGLIRASWSQPKDKPASETVKLQVLSR